MKQLQKTYPGSDRHQHWFMLRTEQQLQHFHQEPWIAHQGRAFLADQVPANLNYTAVKALCIEDVFASETNFVDLPRSLYLFPGLAYLRLPKKYVPQIQPEGIPPSIRVLEIIGEGTVTFPPQLSLPQIERLSGLPTTLKFTPNVFPQLRDLNLHLDSRGNMLAVLAHLDQLETLSLSSNYTEAVFETIGKLRLTALALGNNQKIQTLDGIERLQSLVAVRLANMNHLENMSGLVKLSKLAEVTICWCANLSNYDALLEISTLEHLNIFGCKKFNSAHYGPKLQALPLKTLTYPGIGER